jgi:antitoxin PrlF
MNVNLDEDEGIMMRLFLDFLMNDVMHNPYKLIPYTQEMSYEMDDLLADLIID